MSICLDKVAEIGCIVCLNQGKKSPATIHHLTGIKYRSTGKKASDEHVIPLCPMHHQHGGYGVALHAGVKEWERRYGTQEDLLNQVIGILKKI